MVQARLQAGGRPAHLVAAVGVGVNHWLITAGWWDGSVLCFGRSKAIGVATAWQPVKVAQRPATAGAITCLVADGDIIAFGCESGLAAVWHITCLDNMTLRNNCDATESCEMGEEVSTLRGISAAVVSIGIKLSLDLVVTGTRVGECLIHTLHKGQLLRSLNLGVAGTDVSVEAISIASTANIVVHLSSQQQPWLQVWTINGQLVATAALNEPPHSLQCSPDGRLLLTASSGAASIRWVHNLQAHRPISIASQSDEHVPLLTRMAFTPDGTAVVGATHDGQLREYKIGEPG